ncbi:MAG: DUF4160 domain-containing protein [Acidobacteria bacterium]|nr:DUF4160 domain-containing protein [Acidobacteriota bacterium]
MPTISQFYGITIRMYFNDHPPPHFHAIYGDAQATIDINTGMIIEGDLPARALALVREWALLRRQVLNDNWSRCRAQQPIAQIDPLP